jgi:(1->4)-alpha-D-glucan 1-alpha-D-glucosylmutase
MSTPIGSRRIPVATYRWQLRKEFTLRDAEALVDYAKKLGISEFYCSPFFLSTPGSTHGYDVNDYRRIDPELGGRAGLEGLSAALKKHEMGLLLDFVPNHMGINGPGLFNRWWSDVLENGIHSPYARFFDIDWSGDVAATQTRVLVPLLEDHYGRVVDAGKLSVVYENGGFSIAYYEMRFPVSAPTYRALLTAIRDSSGQCDEIDLLVATLDRLPKPDAREDVELARKRREHLDELKRQLAALINQYPQLQNTLEIYLRKLNGVVGEPSSFERLSDLIEQQHYRLAFWKAGVHETNYRRFFAIDTLIGLRMELPEVFHECHALLSRLIREETVTGLRIDHIDGLRDPQQYLERLQGLGRGDGGESSDPLYVVVEKILAENESLPAEWVAHGATGYEFVTQLTGLFVDARAERRFTETYAEFCGESAAFENVVYDKKRFVLEEMFANAVTRLAGNLAAILQADRHWRDLTRHEITVAVRELMAAHSVYRTYRRGTEVMNERDRRVVEQATAIAISRNRRLGASPFELVRDVLVGNYPREKSTPGIREQLADWVLEFQQYTGAVMAKSVEDTAFYTYGRFIALNEVGGDPGRFGGSVAGFHAANEERLRRTPLAMLTTATHDTKMGEDVRARLYALSEIPHEWRDSVTEWRDLNRRHKTTVDGRSAPDANEEYRLYQILVGAWPADGADPDEAFRARIREHVRKAANEAKRNTSWIQPNDPWLEAGDRFVDRILNADGAREFLASFRPRAQRIAQLGMVNSLAQLVLKITSPGVPDFYQGCELWDLSLVDPDNRHEVDFKHRKEIIGAGQGAVDWKERLRSWRNGEIKLHVTAALLNFRAAHPILFQQGDYQPLVVTGRFADNVVAFSRGHETDTVVVVVPRLVSRLGSPPIGIVWDDTALGLPGGAGTWRDVTTGRRIPGSTETTLAELFSELPFAVLVKE